MTEAPTRRPDRMAPETRARVTSSGGHGRAAAMSPGERAASSSLAAKAMHAPASLARRIVRAWPDLDDEGKAEVLAILSAGLPLVRRRRA